MDDWLPIETAPKDGTTVWLWAPFEGSEFGYVYAGGSFAVHSEGDAPEWRMHSKDIGWCRQHPPTRWKPRQS